MTSLIDEATTSDFQDIGMKVLTHLKTYCLFVFYENSHLQANPNIMGLEVPFLLNLEADVQTQRREVSAL